LTAVGSMLNSGKVQEADFEDFSEGLPMKTIRNPNKVPKTAISQA